MKNAFEWTDLRLFLHVAREQGLSAAGRRTGLSPATLGRAMTRLERWAGVALFVRRPQGYELTRAGTVLFEKAGEVEVQVESLLRWREGEAERTRIRISAGTWVSYFLLCHFEYLCTAEDDFTIDYLTSNNRVDISHRHADIGVRNRRPEEPWLAGQRVGRIHFAPYCAVVSDGDTQTANDWIAIDETAAVTPSSRWVLEHHADRIRVRTSEPRHLLDLAERGVGRAVLPCFIGDERTGLRRCGPLIDALSHDQWLVVHHDERHRGPFRTLIDRIATLLRKNA